jgi:predicted short-subunit dehydrogenase-like oxidoreductase (DUF2520 family)
MQENIIERLFTSFSDLEKAIESARHSLGRKGDIPEEIIQRLASYDTILIKQRGLASSLCEHIKIGDWNEVSRHVGLINGLSAMIRDDARSILSSLNDATSSEQKQEEEEYFVC